MHDPYGLQHFFMARMEEGKRINKQKDPQPAPPMAEMMANVLVTGHLYSAWVMVYVTAYHCIPSANAVVSNRVVESKSAKRVHTATMPVTARAHLELCLFCPVSQSMIFTVVGAS